MEIDKKTSERLISFLEKMLSFYKGFLAAETEKYQDLTTGRLESLNAHMQREEAFVLKARGMELERKRLLEETGIGGKTFRESIPLFPADRQEKLWSLYRELSGTVTRISGTNSRNSTLTKLKLNQISKILSQLENHPELKQIYGDKVTPDVPQEGLYSKKV